MADTNLNDLKEMQKMTSSMLKDYDKLLEGHGKVNKKLKERVEVQKNIVKSITDEKSAHEALKKLEAEHVKLGTKKYDNNKNVILALQMQNRAIQEQIKFSGIVLNAEAKRQAILDKVKGKVDGVGEKMKDTLHTLQHELEHIPVIGKVMSKAIPFDKIKGGIDRMGNAFTGGFKGAFTKTMKQGGSASQAMLAGFRGGISGIGTAISRLGPMLMGPQAIIAGIVAVLALGVVRMYQIEKAADQFKKSTGLLNNDMKGIQRQISSVQAKYAQIGVNAEDVAEYAAAFYNQFEGTQRASDAVLGSMAVLNKNFGIAVEDQTKLNQLLQSSAGLNQEQSQYMIAQVTAAADLANVAPSKVIKDMAENSEAMYNYFHGSAEEMASAALQAAKMGTSITGMTKTADTLLQFETSLSDELQANAMLGGKFNLSLARQKAAVGDLPGMYEEVLNSVQRTKDISQMTKFEQDAIVKATGMQISEIANGIAIRKKFSNASKEELAAGMELLKNGKKIEEVSEEDLKHLVDKQKKQKEMQGQLHALGDMLSGFGSSILDAFLPAGQALITVITPIVSALGAFIKGFISPMANAFKRISDQVGKIFEKFGGMEKAGKILATVFEFLGTMLSGPITFAIEFVMGGISAVVDMVSGLVSILKGLFTGDLKMVGDGIKDVFSGLLTWFLRIPMALYHAFIDMFPKIGEALTGWLSGMWDGITSFFGFGSSDSSKAQSEASAKLEDGGSVDDGIVQGGKIISTNPADTLIATKSPMELLGKAFDMTPLGMIADGIGNLMGGRGGGGSVDMAPLIAEIQGLRADLNAGKIAVNMDGRKVTSVVSKVAGQASANSYIAGR
jgi:hypothetical protein